LIIGTVYKSKSRNGYTVSNIPFDQHDYPCWEGCCDNEETVGLSDLMKVGWLLDDYMVENNISNFDFNNWSDDLEVLWKEKRKQ
jgi:hypothetical protein